MNNILEDEVYDTIDEDSYYGYIISEKEKDYLCFISFMNAYLNIWDLYNKQMIESIEVFSSYSSGLIIHWNNKFIISFDDRCNSFKIIDNNNKNKVISNIKGNENEFKNDNKIIGIKKINHPIYGEVLYSCHKDKTIRLWTI